MPPKEKKTHEDVNPLIFPSVDIHHTILADRDYMIHETNCDIDLFELYCWLEDKYIDQTDELQLWKSNLPYYIFHLTFNAPDFIRRCQASYLLNQRAIVNP